MLSARRIVAAALAGMLALAGCSDGPAGKFSATLEGPLEGEIRGYATFCRRPDRGDFLLVLATQRDSVALVLGRDTAAIPAPGPYAVVDRGDTLAGGRFWVRPELGGLEATGSYTFTVDEGEVRVVSADSSWIRGRFRVQMIARDTAFQIDTLTRTVRRLATEWETVQGTFTAARAEPCAGLAARQ
ncbi:MAG TPA: hypothetical protein VGR37_04520 [Longimicrobiaceae bacterium]|nr:hypothetical protein [Longimicrobiaceae bacterium]